MKKKFPKISIFCLGLILIFVASTTISPVKAQAQNPDDWQNSASGLSTQINDEGKTAGLGFIVQVDDWPTISMSGGVQNFRGRLAGPTGIDLGRIQIPNIGNPSLIEDVDWAHNEMTFAVGPSQLKVWASRLTPTLLTHTTSTVLRLFTGNVSGNRFDGTSVSPLPVSPAYPKFIAYLSAGQILIKQLSTASLSIPALDQNWVLIWYGNNSHFVETKKPISYSLPQEGSTMWPSLSHQYAYQADAPMLIFFQNQPTSIKHPASGGLEINFNGAADYLSILPLFGRDHLSNTQTETWFQGLPSNVLQKIEWWTGHLCHYPYTVSETYGYDATRDSALITESFSFIQMCSWGKTFAMISPMLAISRDNLNVSFSGNLIDANLNTEFGPTLGIEGTNIYSWQIAGLKRYVDPERIFTHVDQAPDEFNQELGEAVEEVIQAGHLAPWIFSDGIPIYPYRGDIYWLNPADTIYQLTEVASALPESNLKTQLISYIRAERTAYPPEDIFNLPLSDGTIRGPYSVSGQAVEDAWEFYHQDVFYTEIPLFNLFALYKYYALTHDPLNPTVWLKANTILDRQMREQDWATLYWFNEFDDRRISVVNANRHFSGLIGYINLAKLASDPEAEAFGRALLAKAAVTRIGMAAYPGYLYKSGLTELPPGQDWQVTQSAGGWIGYLFNYDWSGIDDDPRQVVLLDQFGVLLYDHSGFEEPWTGDRDWDSGLCSPYLVAFRDLTPELGRFLKEYTYPQSMTQIEKYTSLLPNWYAAFSEGIFGAEHNVNHPIDAYQIFLAKAYIAQESTQEMAQYLDIPWIQTGDLFYLQKLAEIINAYQGITWSDSLELSGVARDETIYLRWEIQAELPQDLTWRIDYQGIGGDQPSPIINIPGSLRSYQLTGLTNNTRYTIQLEAISNNTAIMVSNIVTLSPSKYQEFMPFIIN